MGVILTISLTDVGQEVSVGGVRWGIILAISLIDDGQEVKVGG